MAPRFHVLIPARLASTRLPNKPLADIGGQAMVVRVAQQAARSGAVQCVVATDDTQIAQTCTQAGIRALMTRADHPNGSDRLAEACTLLGLADDDVVVNVQGDEPFIEPALIQAVAQSLTDSPDCVMSTAAHALDDADYTNPNAVKVVMDAQGRALYFSRAPIPWWRDGAGTSAPLPFDVWRHMGIYAYRVGFLKRYPSLSISPLEQVESLEQLRVLWHGHRIAVHISEQAPGPGVDTPEDLNRARLRWAALHPSEP